MSAPEKAGRAARDGAGLHVRRERHLAHVHLEDLLAPEHVRVRHHHLAVEAARPEQGRVQHVRPVGGRDQDHALVGLEAVHLHEELVEGLLALVVAAAEACAPVPADRVDLVDEDQAGRVLLALLEHVAHPARADAHEHLDEIGARDREERHVGFARDGASQQGLAGAGRADQQDALRDLAAEALELLGVAQVLDDLLKLLLGFVDAGDVVEGHAALALGQQPCARLAEAHRLAAARLHLAHHEDPDTDEEQQWEPGDEDADDAQPAFLHRHGGDLHVVGAERLDQLGVVGRVSVEGGAVGVVAGDRVALDRHVLDLPGLDLGQELGEREIGGGLPRGRPLKDLEQRHEDQSDDDPKRQILAEATHRSASGCPRVRTLPAPASIPRQRVAGGPDPYARLLQCTRHSPHGRSIVSSTLSSTVFIL